MLNQEERAAKFFDAITKDAEERHEEMTRKTRETVESGLEKAKTKAHSQAQAKIERERMLKEQEFNRTVANERTQQRARLTDKRGAITDEVFGDAREKLTAFTESDGYADFLKKSAAGFAAGSLAGSAFFSRRRCSSLKCSMFLRIELTSLLRVSISCS